MPDDVESIAENCIKPYKDDAMKCGDKMASCWDACKHDVAEQIERAEQRGRELEREECAKCAEETVDDWSVQVINGKVEIKSTKEFIKEKIADAIRNRGEK